MKIIKYILLTSILFGCNDKQAMYIDVYSQCNNGIESAYYYNKDGDKSVYIGHVICDYDESGRIIHEKHFSSSEPKSEIKSESIYDWQENRIVIETRNYYLDQNNRRVINMM